jgi:F0F1-type ATP synthase membrane subunit b/b'
MTEFQTRIQEAFQQAQTRAATRAREFEQEARKVFETLGDRAQAEFKTLLETATKGSRSQIAALGVELEKLGKKLQEIAARAAGRESADGAAKPESSPAQPN